MIQEIIQELLTSQFNQVLEREGREIRAYLGGEQYRVFFRKLKDGNRKIHRLNDVQIFYSVDTPIKTGMQLEYGGKIFLVINQSTIENTAYKVSQCQECNKHGNQF